jgi:hypothetical protein
VEAMIESTFVLMFFKMEGRKWEVNFIFH